MNNNIYGSPRAGDGKSQYRANAKGEQKSSAGRDYGPYGSRDDQDIGAYSGDYIPYNGGYNPTSQRDRNVDLGPYASPDTFNRNYGAPTGNKPYAPKGGYEYSGFDTYYGYGSNDGINYGNNLSKGYDDRFGNDASGSAAGGFNYNFNFSYDKNKGKSQLRHKPGHSDKITRPLIYILLILCSLFVLAPVIYIAVSAFSTGHSIASAGILPFGDSFTLEHFAYLFTETDYPIWFANSFLVASVCCVASILICSVSAYIFSRFNFTFKKPLLLSFMLFQVFPSFIGMIAVYAVLWRIGGLDSLWGVMLVYIAGNIPFNTWMVKNYIDAIPRCIDDAARIDGATGFTVFHHIILPLIRPIVVFLGLTSFAAPWVDFVIPSLVLRSSEKQTIALGLFSLISDSSGYFTAFAAGSLIFALPFIVIFIFFQNSISESLASATVKDIDN